MLKIVEKTISNPVRMPIKPGISVKAGMVGKLVDYKGNLVVDIADSHRAFGIIGTKRKIEGDEVSFDREDMVNIWPQRMVVKTDIFDPVNHYRGGQSLYVARGILTPDPPLPDSYVVAKLTMEPTGEERRLIELLWL